MSNIIGFLENVGRDAALHFASRAQLLQAMQREAIASPLQAAMIGADRAQMEALLGVKEKMYCMVFKTPTPKKAPAKKKPAKAPPKKTPAKKPAKKAPAKRGGKR